MRGIVLMFAGSLVAACSGPGDEPSPNSGADQQQEGYAAPDKPVPAEPIEHPNKADPVDEGKDRQAGSANPCLMQAGDRLQVTPIRAVGTEPFWGARVEGRCVTYSTPENQRGVRVWTRYSAGDNGRATWAGQLDGSKFQMRVRPETACSDGMSDQSYPLAVELTVNGEERRGCAQPL